MTDGKGHGRRQHKKAQNEQKSTIDRIISEKKGSRAQKKQGYHRYPIPIAESENIPPLNISDFSVDEVIAAPSANPIKKCHASHSIDKSHAGGIRKLSPKTYSVCSGEPQIILTIKLPAAQTAPEIAATPVFILLKYALIFIKNLRERQIL